MKKCLLNKSHFISIKSFCKISPPNSIVLQKIWS